MRNAARLAGVVLLAVCLVSCSQAQVLQLQSQVLTLDFSSTGVAAELFNVWDVIEDNDNNNMADPGTTPFLFCERIAGIVSITTNSAPWPHSLRVSILRANSNEFEQLTDDMYVPENANMSRYDNRVIFGSNNIPKPPTTVNGRTFRWTNARQMTTLNESVARSTAADNVLHQLAPSTYPYRGGLCSLGDPGPATIAGQPSPLTFDLGKGDTIRVEARKAFSPAPELATILQSAAPNLTANVTVDGVVVNGLLSGQRSSASGPGEGLSFTYSSR